MKENVHPTEVVSPQQESTEGSSSNIANKRPPRKSLIPVPSPPKKEKVVERKALTPIQPPRKSSISSKMLGRQSSATVVASSSPVKKLGGPANSRPRTPSSPLSKPTCTSTPISTPIPASGKHKSAVKIFTDNTVDKEVQTDHPDLQLITGDEPPPSYWKDLAETRRQALEEALTENQGLCQKVEELEKENEILEEMLKHAKDMVEMLSPIYEDDSGIGDESTRSVNQSVIETVTAAQEDDKDD